MTKILSSTKNPVHHPKALPVICMIIPTEGEQDEFEVQFTSLVRAIASPISSDETGTSKIGSSVEEEGPSAHDPVQKKHKPMACM